MSEHNTEVPPDLVETRDPSKDSPEDTIAGILREAQRANILETGLREGDTPASEPEQEDERGLTPTDYGYLRDAGIDPETLTPTRPRSPRPPSELEGELLEEAAQREVEAGGWDTTAGVRLAQCSPEAFSAFVEQLFDGDETIQEILEEYGATSLEDIPNSQTFQDLSPEEQATLGEVIRSTEAGAYVTGVYDQLVQQETASARADLAQARQREQKADAEAWTDTALRALGASHLDKAQLGQLGEELEGFRLALVQGGPQLMEKMIDGFDPTIPEHMGLWQQLCVPITSRAGDDPELAHVARATRAIASRTTRAERNRRYQQKVLEDGLPRNMLDRERKQLLEDWEEVSRKSVISMSDLKALMRKDPTPARSGEQVARDIQHGGRGTNPSSAEIRAELDRVAARVEKRNREKVRGR